MSAASASAPWRPTGGRAGALLVAGTTSDAGKSLITAGICRWLRREGVRVAPFKAQNMALNAAVTPDGLEIGRAQATQAAAAGVEPEAAMNPVLLKPTSDRESQVVVLGRVHATAGFRDYRAMRAELRDTVLCSLEELRERFDAVICEGAGSPAEINLREGDYVNMGLARAADLPAIVVGDIDRGGVLAALYGTVALLDPADQAHVAGLVINKFRGDPVLLAPGLRDLEALTARPVLGVVPWAEGLELEAEDILGLRGLERAADDGTVRDRADVLHIAVLGLRRISNFTDLDALAAEPMVQLAVTRDPDVVREADLVVVPGSKTTVGDLADLRALGLDRALAERAARGRPILGICGGYQMLGRSIQDRGIESGSGTCDGLGLLPVTTVMAAAKLTRRRVGVLLTDDDGTPGGAARADDAPRTSAGRSHGATHAEIPAAGYEIRHGRVRREGGRPLLRATDAHDPGAGEGCVCGVVLGTSWHGLLEHDAARRALLGWTARRADRTSWRAGDTPFAVVRERRLDLLGDLVEEHLDTAALRGLLEDGMPRALPALACGPVS